MPDKVRPIPDETLGLRWKPNEFTGRRNSAEFIDVRPGVVHFTCQMLVGEEVVRRGKFMP